MFRFICFFVFLFLFSFHSSANDFKFSTLIRCGPEKLSIEDFDKKPFDQTGLYFDIYFNLEGDKFVVLNLGQQYPSFRDIEYEELFTQSGGILSSSGITQNGNVIITLLTRYRQNNFRYENDLIINLDDGTFKYINNHFSEDNKKTTIELISNGSCWVLF